MKKQIPNIITGLNLISGLFGIYFCSVGNLIYASYALLIAMIFDFLDGASARALKCSSEFGKQFDSLADLTSFGIVPGYIVFNLLSMQAHLHIILFQTNILPFISFTIPLLSAIRLAKFNIDTKQSTVFYGLPTPANALFWSSIPIILYFGEKSNAMQEIILHPYFIIISTIVFSFMLIANVKMIALKFTNTKFNENWSKYILILSALLLLIVLKIYALPLIVALYILLSLIHVAIEK